MCCCCLGLRCVITSSNQLHEIVVYSSSILPSEKNKVLSKQCREGHNNKLLPDPPSNSNAHTFTVSVWFSDLNLFEESSYCPATRSDERREEKNTYGGHLGCFQLFLRSQLYKKRLMLHGFSLPLVSPLRLQRGSEINSKHYRKNLWIFLIPQ